MDVIAAVFIWVPLIIVLITLRWLNKKFNFFKFRTKIQTKKESNREDLATYIASVDELHRTGVIQRKKIMRAEVEKLERVFAFHVRSIPDETLQKLIELWQVAKMANPKKGER